MQLKLVTQCLDEPRASTWIPPRIETFVDIDVRGVNHCKKMKIWLFLVAVLTSFIVKFEKVKKLRRGKNQIFISLTYKVEIFFVLYICFSL